VLFAIRNPKARPVGTSMEFSGGAAQPTSSLSGVCHGPFYMNKKCQFLGQFLAEN
jgi:hypothetical protein